MLLVYIASPYSHGDREFNVQRQIEASHRLIDWGYLPLAPLVIGHSMEQVRERPYSEWMECCYGWLSRCDVMLRLEGTSKGADMEVAEATRLGIPVVYSIEELARVMGQ